MTASGKTVLFQGDSITDGNRGRDGDPNHIHGHGYVYLIAAELGFELADSRPRFINRGLAAIVHQICMRDGMRMPFFFSQT